jgi:mannose-6-phosphate isomerase-like protein (cupin superfamily)
MQAGETIELGKGETITCVRSSADGGPFEFTLELAAGVDGPPTHHHPDPECVEVVQGRVVFILDGEKRELGPGDVLEIPPGVPHTFFVPKGTEVLRAKGKHGARFERVVDQHAGGGARFMRMAMYLMRVDPEASYMVNPVVRGLLRVIAAVGRLRGVELHDQGPTSSATAQPRG